MSLPDIVQPSRRFAVGGSLSVFEREECASPFGISIFCVVIFILTLRNVLVFV